MDGCSVEPSSPSTSLRFLMEISLPYLVTSEIFGIDTMRFDSDGILGEPIDDFVEHRLQDDSGGIEGVDEFLLVVVAKMESSKLMKLKGELF